MITLDKNDTLLAAYACHAAAEDAAFKGHYTYAAVRYELAARLFAAAERPEYAERCAEGAADMRTEGAAVDLYEA